MPSQAPTGWLVRSAIALALLASGCIPTATGPELPTWCASGDCVGVPADVSRTGTIHVTGECIWMQIDGQRAAVLWPPHFTARFSPSAAILNESGEQVAKDGDELTTVILGPKSKDKDACGLVNVVELYFNQFAP